MKKVIALLAFALIGSLATAELAPTAIANPGVLGSWKSARPVFSGNGMNVYFGISFNADSTADVSSLCSYPGKNLEATVRVPVDVTATTVEVQGAGQNQVQDGNYNCNVEVQQGKVAYTLAPGRLRLTTEDGTSLDFVRR